MTATVIRQRAVSALIVGAKGANVLSVVTAFEEKRIVTLREDTIAGACERIALEMPLVVLMLIPPADGAERDAIADRALAVGALVVHLDPALDSETFKQMLTRTVQAVLERKRARDDAERQGSRTGDASDALPTDDVDRGWNE